MHFQLQVDFKNSIGVSQYITGAIIAVLLFFVISGGIKRIAKTAELIVPFMTIGFILMTVIVMILRIKEYQKLLA